MNTLITEIEQYLHFLISERGLYVSLHPFGRGMSLLDTSLRIYNIHRNGYCLFLKGIPGVQEKCARCQEKAWQKSKKGEFFGVCHGGVGEFVYPLRGTASESLGFISVSGYLPSDRGEHEAALSAAFALSREKIRSAARCLFPLPEKEGLDALIHPLQRMLELYFACEPRETEPKSFDQRVISYLHDHYKESITSEKICRDLFCSRSYLSHRFQKKHGKSLRDYVNHLRVRDAARLLAHSDMSIGEVAAATGFGDSNYFSKSFKKLMGISPSHYRKENKT